MDQSSHIPFDPDFDPAPAQAALVSVASVSSRAAFFFGALACLLLLGTIGFLMLLFYVF